MTSQVTDQTAIKQDIEQLEQQSFAETSLRTRTDLSRFWRVAVFLGGLTLSLFHLYTAAFGTLPSHQQRTFHLAFGLGLIFLLYPARREKTTKGRVAGWVLTGVGFAVIGAMYSNGEIAWYAALPAALVLTTVQAARYLPGQILGMPVADVLLSAMGFTAGLYLFVNSSDIIRQGARIPAMDPSLAPSFVVATIGVLLVLVAAQRAVGSALTVLAALMLAYAYFGEYMPGFLGHAGFSVDRILQSSFISTEGVFGTPIAVSSTFIYLFLIFAAMLQRTGMERFFTKLAVGAAGRFTGGTAKVGVLTSAFSGTITGSSVANTVSNGAFTIPMMRRSGYSREFAGAVEASSSTGGQLAPPIMGAAAFIMIEMTPPEIGYIDIIKAAAVPAALFFVAQFIVIHYESKKQGIRGLPPEQLPSVRRLLLAQGYLLAPILLIFVILATGRTPIFAATWAIIFTIVVNLVAQLVVVIVGAIRRPVPAELRGTREGLQLRVDGAVATWRGFDDKLTPRTLAAGLVDASRLALPIIAACAAAGMIAGIITLSGLGLKLIGGLTNLAVDLAGGLSTMAGWVSLPPVGPTGLLLITLVLVMIACLVLGIGVPTTANYVITATLAAPVIVSLLQGELPEPTLAMILMAHLFVYYFGVIADITPPVCLAAYAAAGISGGSPIRTGVWSLRIAISGFLVPYMFVLSPQLLLLDVTFGSAVLVFITALVGVTCLGAAVVGYIDRPINVVTRLVLAAAGLSLLSSDVWTDLFGFAVFVLVFGYHWRYRRSVTAPDDQPVTAPPSPSPDIR